MSIENPKKPTPEEIAEIEKSRTLSDAELLKGGAKYDVDEETGDTRIKTTEEQIEEIKQDHNREEMRIEFAKLPNMTEDEHIKKQIDERNKISELIRLHLLRVPDMYNILPERAKIAIKRAPGEEDTMMLIALRFQITEDLKEMIENKKDRKEFLKLVTRYGDIRIAPQGLQGNKKFILE